MSNPSPNDAELREQIQALLIGVVPGETRVSYPDGSSKIWDNYQLLEDDLMRLITERERLARVDELEAPDTIPRLRTSIAADIDSIVHIPQPDRNYLIAMIMEDVGVAMEQAKLDAAIEELREQ